MITKTQKARCLLLVVSRVNTVKFHLEEFFSNIPAETVIKAKKQELRKKKLKVSWSS